MNVNGQAKQLPTSDEVEYIGHLQVLTLQPGDRLIVTLSGSNTQVEQMEFVGKIKKWLGDTPCLIVNDKVQLGVLRESK